MNKANLDELKARLNKAEQQIEALKEIGLAIESTMSFDEVLSHIVLRITKLMDAERSTLFLRTDEGELVSRVLEGNEVNEIRLSSGQGIAGWTARCERPLLITDAQVDQRFDRTWDEKTGFQTRSVICHPIFGRNEVLIGVAEVLNKVNGEFEIVDLELLGLLCSQLALTIENSIMMTDLVQKNEAVLKSKQDLEKRNKELNALLDIETAVARADTFDNLCSLILTSVSSIVDCDVSAIHRVDENGAEGRIYVKSLDKEDIFREDPGSGFAGWVAAKNKALCLDEPFRDPRFKKSIVDRIGCDLNNLAAVPLPFSEESNIRASLLVANKNGTECFTPGDLMLLRLVAVHVSQAMTHLLAREAGERERRLATVGRLLAGVLHDLRSPITVASGYAEMLASLSPGNAESEEYLKHIELALSRITEMSSDIIAFSKGEKNVLVHNCLIKELMESFVAQNKNFLESNNIRLDMRLRITGSARLDQVKMLRVFNNIAINAVEAMPQGGELIVEVDKFGQELVFSFTDTGSGIPEQIQGSLFQSFVTLGKEHGTGLGLAVAREIVEAHGGTINFTSQSNTGTTFLISIPF